MSRILTYTTEHNVLYSVDSVWFGFAVYARFYLSFIVFLIPRLFFLQHNGEEKKSIFFLFLHLFIQFQTRSRF